MTALLRPLLFSFAVGIVVCIAAQDVHGAPISVRDSSGRLVVINNADRIVSVGGAITEILYALGRDKQIVAVDSTSLYPEQALKEKRNVGYMRQLSPEGVLGLNPSLLLTVDGAGPKETINVLHASGIPMVSVPDKFTGAGVLDKISLVAAAAGAPNQGECLATSVKADLDALGRVYAEIGKSVKVMFVLSMAGDRLLAAGKDTAADGIIKLAGAVNAISAYDGYKAVSDEAVIDAAPDVILTMQHGRHPMSTDEVFAHPAFKLTPAAARKAHVSLDGLYMLGFGPRTASAARDLAAAFYPNINTKLPSEAGAAANGCRG